MTAKLEDGQKVGYTDSGTSSDFYVVSANNFQQINVSDSGGGSDRLNLKAYNFNQFTYEPFDFDGNGSLESLHMTGAGTRDIFVLSQRIGSGKIESFQFADGTRSADEIPV